MPSAKLASCVKERTTWWSAASRSLPSKKSPFPPRSMRAVMLISAKNPRKCREELDGQLGNAPVRNRRGGFSICPDADLRRDVPDDPPAQQAYGRNRRRPPEAHQPGN